MNRSRQDDLLDKLKKCVQSIQNGQNDHASLNLSRPSREKENSFHYDLPRGKPDNSNYRPLREKVSVPTKPIESSAIRPLEASNRYQYTKHSQEVQEPEKYQSSTKYESYKNTADRRRKEPERHNMDKSVPQNTERQYSRRNYEYEVTRQPIRQPTRQVTRQPTRQAVPKLEARHLRQSEQKKLGPTKSVELSDWQSQREESPREDPSVSLMSHYGKKLGRGKKVERGDVQREERGYVHRSVGEEEQIEKVDRMGQIARLRVQNEQHVEKEASALQKLRRISELNEKINERIRNIISTFEGGR